MHRALFISEVLQDIFAHLDQFSSSGSLTTLAAVARTCKIFHEPAMDLLWADMIGIIPLLGCVARLQPMIYTDDKYTSWERFSSKDVEPLSTHEARQFLHHAARVRSVYVSADEHLHLLTVIPIGTCVFPRLLSLFWMQDTTQFLYLFLSPTLDSCALSSLYPESKSIGTRCVVLKELIILPAVGRTTDGSLLSDTVRSCKKLVRVCCSSLDSAAWKHLTSLHTLRAIEIDGSNCPLDLDDFIFAPFLNVTTLSFVVDKAEDNIRLIQRSQFPSLKEFEFTMGSQALSWAEVEQLFRGLSQCKACQTLERITLDSHYASEIQQRTGDSFTAIRQLSRFTQLQTLSLSIGNFIYPDNDLLLEAASSWPHLRCLKLVDYYFPRPSAVTFCGLFAALRLCPHLHTLWLSMDAVNIDTDPAAESFQHTSLKTFHVLSSSVAHPETVACIISSMLPCVAQVDYDTWSEGNIAMSWAAVNDLLKNFKSSAAAVRGITGVKQH